MQRRSTWLAVAAGVGAAGVAIAAGWSLVRSDDRQSLDSESIDSESIVMLGDSITEQGDWTELLPDWPVVNAGRSGYTTAQLVPVAAEVASRSPDTVFVLTGTNDIRDGHPPEWTSARLTELVGQITRVSPETEIVVQTVPPRDDRPDEASATADAIAATASSGGLTMLDLHSAFDDGSGRFRAEETTDGIHLSDAGYERWAAILIDALHET